MVMVHDAREKIQYYLREMKQLMKLRELIKNDWEECSEQWRMFAFMLKETDDELSMLKQEIDAFIQSLRHRPRRH